MADDMFLMLQSIKKRLRLSESDSLRKKTNSTSLNFRRNNRSLKKKMQLVMAILLFLNPPVNRLIWMFPRSDRWFKIAKASLPEREWYANFRVSKDTFYYILSEIVDDITRKDTKLRKAISPEKRVAITLYYIGSTSEYRTIANLFGVSTAFVCLCVKDVCTAILTKLKSRFLSIPKDDDLREVMRLYKLRWGFPVCAGAIDGTHIAIQAPAENHTDYVNRKSYHSIVMQAVVDSHYLFRYIVVGWPDSVHHARVLSNSQLYNLGVQEKLFERNMNDKICGVGISPVLLGDPAYPLLQWLMKAYPENPNTSLWQRNFNYRLSRARMSVENTFGRWKGRFRRFLKRVDMVVDSATCIVAASCIIHNICELRRDEFLHEWLEDVRREANNQPDDLVQPWPDRENEKDASTIRDTLAEFFQTADGRNIGIGGE
ncbi:putative nuclease HARBI1 [Dendronephthya gigantea]|uniref:putative nuclease HARBI1 n=1 Tax=Dendronephthya gigantea TaxID=151771 RepID=UPI00106D98E3|nr:putative nuclease HARBI1 [Dendronephthya gigantea]